MVIYRNNCLILKGLLLFIYLHNFDFFCFGNLNISKYKYLTLNEGEFVEDYKLNQRVNILGLPKIYSRDSASKSRDDDYSFGKILFDSYDVLSQDMKNGLIYQPQEERDKVLKYQQASMIDSESQIVFNEKKAKISCLEAGFCLEEHIFKGGHGEVWRAFKPNQPNQSYILKRMHVRNKPDILRCALREIFFGTQLREELPDNVAKYETYFILNDDYWLVYIDEGVSLQQILYAVTLTESIAILEPSLIWKRIRTTKEGQETLRSIMHAIISNVAKLHSIGILHRDLKPSNILVNVTNNGHVKIVIADFSSSVSQKVYRAQLYGNNIPADFVFPITEEYKRKTSSSEFYNNMNADSHFDFPSPREETVEYAPPEVILCDLSASLTPNKLNYQNCAFDEDFPYSYDIWSIGVIFLEFILGTAHIFNTDQKTYSMIKHKLKKIKLSEKKAGDFHSHSDAYFDRKLEEYSYQASLSEFCIFNRTLIDVTELDQMMKFNSLYLVSVCSIKDIAKAVLRRDPLGVGFHDENGLDLLSKLLKWDPSEDALAHPYFTSSPSSSSSSSSSSNRNENESKPKSTSSDSGSLSPMKSKEIIIFSPDPNADKYDSIFMKKLYDFFKSPYKELIESPSLRHLKLGQSSWYNHLQISSYANNDDNTLKDDEDNNNSPTTQASSDFQGVISTYSDTDNVVFWCPVCGKSFKGNWDACHFHVTSRKHGNECVYSDQVPMNNISSKIASKISESIKLNDLELPRCISDHLFLPVDAHSGWCDLQGRRAYIEDSHAVVFSDPLFTSHNLNGSKMNHSFRLFGVFDGHLGNRASNFLTRYLPHLFESYLNKKENKSSGNFEINSSSTLINDDWINSRVVPYGNHIIDLSLGNILRSKEAIQSLHNAFVFSNIEFISRSHDQETSGSTATIAILLGPEAETPSYPLSFTSHPSYKYLLIGHVGDSRAVLCCKSYQQGEAIPLTVDHTPSVPVERARVVEKGGFIESTKSIPRVNGQLAVTRSIGDKKLRMYLSSIPDLILLKLEREIFDEADQTSSNKYDNICYKYFNQRNINKSKKFIHKFLILASDGLWDVISNQEAVNFTCKYLLNSLLRNENSNDVLPTEAFHFAAKALAVEAFIRGSSDNIGVCIIDII